MIAEVSSERCLKTVVLFALKLICGAFHLRDVIYYLMVCTHAVVILSLIVFILHRSHFVRRNMVYSRREADEHIAGCHSGFSLRASLSPGGFFLRRVQLLGSSAELLNGHR